MLPLNKGFIWFLINYSSAMLLTTFCMSQYLTVMGDLVGTENLPHALGFSGLLNGVGSTLGPVLGGTYCISSISLAFNEFVIF